MLNQIRGFLDRSGMTVKWLAGVLCTNRKLVNRENQARTHQGQ
jgi:hypothetical protein